MERIEARHEEEEKNEDEEADVYGFTMGKRSG